MSSTNKIIKTISLTCTFVLAVTAARAVLPPPDGGYPNANTAEGDGALFSLTTGFGNTAIGFEALFKNTTGVNNTAIGNGALSNDVSGFSNTANGSGALFTNAGGNSNTAVGSGALFSNAGGNSNTATGALALINNDSGNSNTAAGVSALQSNNTGNNNTATGYRALYFNTTGSNNLANGYQALFYNTTGVNNMATGFSALYANTTGFYNMANGSSAMVHNTTGSYNVAEGLNALRLNTTGNSNTAVGLSALLKNTTGGANIALGGSAGSALTTGSNNIDIGNNGVAAESGKIRLGTKGKQTSTYIAGISGAAVAGGVGVIVDTNGHLGTVVSSARFKEAIKPMDRASEVILALQPVSFRYKKELDPDEVPQFGLVAEEVARVAPHLVVPDEQGRPFTVRYEEVNAMLLNEFLKEHRKVEEQAEINQRQETTIARLEAALKAQAAQIQKVSDQLRSQGPAPRVVAND